MSVFGVTSTTSTNRLPGATVPSAAHASSSRWSVSTRVTPRSVPVSRVPQTHRDARDREPLLIRLLEETFQHASVRIANERARIGNTVEPACGIHFSVEQIVAFDRVPSRIREPRVLDTACLGVALEDVGRIAGDGDQADATRLQVRIAALQLHELRLAVRSLVGRATEDEHHAVRAHERRQVACLPTLVDEGKGEHGVADLRAERSTSGSGCSNCAPSSIPNTTIRETMSEDHTV